MIALDDEAHQQITNHFTATFLPLQTSSGIAYIRTYVGMGG